MVASRATGVNSGVRWVIDTRASQFTVQAFASGLVSVIAHSPKIAIREWNGEVRMTSRSLENTGIKVTIKAAALEVLDELRDADRKELHRVMNQDVLETSRYPDISFESTEVKAEKVRDDLYKVNIRGLLNLHGIANEHSFTAQVSMAEDSARAYGEFSIRQSDHEIRIAAIAGGTLKLQDDLKFSFYVLARLQP
jgi:polyisoprenoid-binding protein YceI